MSKLSSPDLTYRVSSDTVIQSLDFLQRQGNLGHEGVVLWPGRLEDGICIVAEAIIPKQVTGRLFYRIPNDETFRIIRYVAERDLVIPIQIHSHPCKAFHSAADDKLAFVQHENAISIVVPDFARFPLREFTKQAKVYRLHTENEWIEIPAQDAWRILQFENL